MTDAQEGNRKIPLLLARFTDMSLAAVMIWAMIIGTAVGIFFGERIAWMGDIGNAVILLMQMTIYPFIVVSLIEGIGRLNKENAQKLFSKLALVLVLVMLICTTVIFTVPVMFPTIETASFFSTSVVAPPPEIDYLKLYVPSNPFASLAEGSVPAIVLFSIALGVAMITVNNKSSFMELMQTTSEGLSLITQNLIKILPIGIFGMSASAAGTITFEEFASLQVFLISYMSICVFLTFWLLPFCINIISPIKGTACIRVCREALVTAFTTGNIFICLPVLMEGCKQLLRESELNSEEDEHNVDILLPVVYTFPNVGKATILLFILFSGWFVGNPIEISTYPQLAVSGIMSLFGSVYASIPFLLDQAKLPTDMMQLFVVSSFLTSKFNSMVAAMHLLVITLLTVLVVRGKVTLQIPHLVFFSSVSVVLLIVMLVGGRIGMANILPAPENTAIKVQGMRALAEVPANVYDEVPKTLEGNVVGQNTIDRIFTRGSIRVGYRLQNVPFTYFNSRHELVGFDINLANKLASSLNVAVEFIPITLNNLIPALQNGFIDIAMSGIAMDTSVLTEITFSDPLMNMNLAFVTQDYRLKEFPSIAAAQAIDKPLTVAFVGHQDMVERAKRNSRFQRKYIQLDSYIEFFEQSDNQYDLLVTSAEAGFAWTMLYPQYGVVLPDDSKVQFPIAFALAQDNRSLLQYVDNWLKVQKARGLIDGQYNYWILGQGAKPDKPRWNIMTDVLGIK